MDALDSKLLAFLSERENWEQYGSTINKGLCTRMSWDLLKDFGEYYEANPTTNVIDSDFTLWLRIDKYPGKKPEEHETYGRIITNIEEQKAAYPIHTESFIHTLQEARKKYAVLGHTKEYEAGRIDFDEFVRRCEAEHTHTISGATDHIIELLLSDLAEHTRDNEGYYWRLEDNNKSIGPVRDGDLIVIAKRPEVGGTSFLVSEMSFMFEQLDGKDAIIFNNEEAPDKVYTRLISAALGLDYRTIIGDPAKYQSEYTKWLDGRKIDIVHDGQMSVASIRATLNKGNYGLVGVNVLLKVGGSGKQEDHDKLQFLGEEMRRVAQDYGPTFCIVQADPSAENTTYIPQDRIYKSKTALQGEADVLIMIGKLYDDSDDIRYIHVAKNKIPPAACVDLGMKHGKTEVNFNLPTGRFMSQLFKGNSRWTKKPSTSTST